MKKAAGLLIAAAVVIAIFAITISRKPAPEHAAAPTTEVPQVQAPAALYNYEVVHEYPHDLDAVTEGLIYHDGFLYESTGLRGRSSIRKVRLETGEILQRRDLDDRYFGEGITEWHGKLLQLTTPIGTALGPGKRIWEVEPSVLWRVAERLWNGDAGMTYDPASLQPQATFKYHDEGWGLTHDDRRLILSNGTSNIRFLDPVTFQRLGRIITTDQGREIAKWNELEFIDGEIYANVWQQDRIAIINPQTGQVRAWIMKLAELRSRMVPPPQTDDTLGPAGYPMLNGIAYDATRHRLFVTGKRWPRLFEIRLLRK
jgi:glutaminyl-peptide cyclotransferase